MLKQNIILSVFPTISDIEILVYFEENSQTTTRYAFLSNVDKIIQELGAKYTISRIFISVRNDFSKKVYEKLLENENTNCYNIILI